MSKYRNEHAGALADVQAAGAAITWTRSAPTASTYEALTDVDTPADPTTISGHAIETQGDRDTYRRLSLTHDTAVTLFFTPTEIGDVPRAGDTAVWNGATVTVLAREALAPDGVAIAATVVCRR